jgi:hypothetical protein
VVDLYIDNGQGPVRNPSLSDAEFNAGLAQVKADNQAAIKAAAYAYIDKFFNSTEMAVWSAGAAKSLPHSLANVAWLKSVRSLAASRIAAATPTYNPADMDFSSLGAPLWTADQIVTEVLGA